MPATAVLKAARYFAALSPAGMAESRAPIRSTGAGWLDRQVVRFGPLHQRAGANLNETAAGDLPGKIEIARLARVALNDEGFARKCAAALPGHTVGAGQVGLLGGAGNNPV